MLLGRLGPDEGWRPLVAEAFPTHVKHLSSYRLCTVVEEIGTWVAAAPMSAWNRRRNIGSLLLDLEAAAAACGPAVHGCAGPAISALVDDLASVQQSREADRPRHLPTVGASVAALRAVLADPATRVAAWHDIVDAGQPEPPNLDVLDERVELLTELVITSGSHPGLVFSDLIDVLWPSTVAHVHNLDAADESWTDDQRAGAGAGSVARQPDSGRCVVWLNYFEARIPNFVTELGAITLFDGEWCAGNAAGETGQDFLFKAEFRQAFDLDRDIELRDGRSPWERQVVARVDLGRRNVYRAVEDAERAVDSIVSTVSLLSGAPRWRRGDRASTFIDGRGGRTSLGLPAGWTPPEPDHYGMNGFAEGLRLRRDMLAQIAAETLPIDVSEALRLITEAGQVDSRENSLGRTATIADRTVIVLQVSALERLAVYAGTSLELFGARLTASWPASRYWHLVGSYVEDAVGYRGGANDPLDDVYSQAPNGRTTNLRVAYELRGVLLADSPSRTAAARAAPFVASLGDAAAAHTMYSALTDEATRLWERTLRCRNALMHGSPVSDAAVLSVRPFLRFITDTALTLTLRGLSGRSGTETELAAVEQRNAAELDRLRAGVSHYDFWVSQTG